MNGEGRGGSLSLFVCRKCRAGAVNGRLTDCAGLFLACRGRNAKAAQWIAAHLDRGLLPRSVSDPRDILAVWLGGMGMLLCLRAGGTGCETDSQTDFLLRRMKRDFARKTVKAFWLTGIQTKQ